MDSTQLVQTLRRWALYACVAGAVLVSAFVSAWLLLGVVVTLAVIIWIVWYNNPNRKNEDFKE